MQSVIRLLPLVAMASALVPATRSAEPVLEPRLLGTSAELYIYNEWGKTVTAVGSNSKHMAQGPPASIKVAANSISRKYAVEAEGMIPIQSSFRLTLQPEFEAESVVDIDIGVSPWRTAYTVGRTNPSNQVAVMLAPAKILEAGRDFDFHVISGPGSFTGFANGLIDSKIPEFIQGVKDKPPTFKVNVPVLGDVEITIRDIVNYNVKSPYTSLSLSTNVIKALVNLSGEVRLTIKSGSKKQDANIKVSGASLLLTAKGNIFAQPLKIDVEGLAVSLQDLDIGGDLLPEIIGGLYPIFAPVLKLPYKLASFVNTSENAKIVGLVNQAIKALTNGGI
ncbi:hypothetical protein DRE_00209 [Drechslerella stenobrocha 248]|uniref:Lipid-binding serum glycoprotein C-terminal domain-containing protein n=1 Tax=Drechslerella stenobrocha 248 TaxID=1043628 RepID=W7HZG5_9PEZI|nr:hypothetical protein DRE_00209 [Drechslerella stenobrocha 248]